MIKLAFFNVAIAATVLLACGCSTSKRSSSVFICTGLTGDAYHSRPDCKGLATCDGELGDVTVADAREIGLHPCKICFPKDSVVKFNKENPGTAQ